MEQDPSVRDIDLIVKNAKDPQKKFSEKPSRNEQTYEVCIGCGDLKLKDSNQCTCGQYTSALRKAYTKYKLSADNSL